MILRVCRIWWPLRRFATIICSCLQTDVKLTPCVGNFEDQPHYPGSGAHTYRRRRPAPHETGCWYLREGVRRTTHSKRNSYHYLDSWIQPVRVFGSAATTSSTQLSHHCFVAGTRICGVQMLMCSDRSAGSKRKGKLNHPLGCMETCTVTHRAPAVRMGTDLARPALRFPEALGAASGGESGAVATSHSF